jgi:hypothetical protein
MLNNREIRYTRIENPVIYVPIRHQASPSFEHLSLCNLDFFRISCLGFRISVCRIDPYPV